mgnify:CR=1 FL=1
MELSKEQMEKVIYELECNYNSKIFDDENLIEIINLFKNYLNSGETKWTFLMCYVTCMTSKTWQG